MLNLHINDNVFWGLPPLSPAGDRHIVPSTKQLHLANHPDHLPRGQEALGFGRWGTAGIHICMLTQRHNKRQCPPKRSSDTAAWYRHTVTSGTCVTHLSTKVCQRVLERKDHGFLYSPFWSRIMTREWAKSLSPNQHFLEMVGLKWFFNAFFFFFKV